MKYSITVINSIHIKDTNSVCIYRNCDILKIYTVLVGGAIYMTAMIVSLYEGSYKQEIIQSLLPYFN